MHHIKSLYYANVQPEIIEYQAKALRALGLEVVQDKYNGLNHGQWLTHTVQNMGDEDCILFLDIDCVPLNAKIVEQAFQAASEGKIFGSAQIAEHLKSDFTYAGPMFLCFSKETWLKLGSPNLEANDECDVGASLSLAAQKQNIDVILKYPNYCLVPKWVIQGKFPFGLGTFYEGEIFHLFIARKRNGYTFAFVEVCKNIMRHEKVDFNALYKEAHSFKRKLLLLKEYILKKIGR